MTPKLTAAAKRRASMPLRDQAAAWSFRWIKCWVCIGTGYVRGPLYMAPCPNEHCPHRLRAAQGRGRK